MTKAFGIDVSRHDGLLDYTKLAARRPRVVFMGFRATISWGYRDPFFAVNWVPAAGLGIARMAYHVVYPAENPLRQVDNLFAQIGSVFTDRDGIVLDVELESGAHDVPVRVYTATVRRMADLIRARTGRLPILYSRAEFIDRRLDYRELRDLDLWLAAYLKTIPELGYANEHPGPPPLPRGADGWLIHQTGDKTPNICATSGKAYQDYNRWNGTEEDVRRYFGIDAPPDTPNLEQRVAAIEARLDKIETKLEDCR